MANRPAIPRRIEKALFQEVGSRCPICGETNVSSLTVHHIVEFATVKEHDPKNMIVLCANCHARAQNYEIPPDDLFEIKRRIAKQAPSSRPPVQPKAKVNRVRIVKGSIAAGRDVNVGGDIVFQSGRRVQAPPRPPVPGTVSEDKWKVGYLKYLGHRFNKFKEWEMNKRGEKMRHAVIWKQYRDELKFNVEQTPLELFARAAEYLMRRVDGTMLGRIRKNKGGKNYRQFEEFARLGEDSIDFTGG